MDVDQFPVVDVTSWRVVAVEPEGLDAMDWLADPATGRTWLFKPVTAKDGRVQGEDGAEKVVSEVASSLGVPCAAVHLARQGGQTGSISLNLRPEGWQLQSGAVLLAGRRAPRYRSSKTAGRPGHTPENIRDVLHGCAPPAGLRVDVEMTAFGAFAGFLVLDALVANRDRHDQNWAVLFPNDAAPAEPRLCGSYDHAGSLGYNLTDTVREGLLDKPGGVRRWVERGTAWRFEHDPRAGKSNIRSLVDLADLALTLATPRERQQWLSAVDAFDVRTGEAALARVPGLSDVARTFAVSVMLENKRRLLDECR